MRAEGQAMHAGKPAFAPISNCPSRVRCGPVCVVEQGVDGHYPQRAVPQPTVEADESVAAHPRQPSDEVGVGDGQK